MPVTQPVVLWLGKDKARALAASMQKNEVITPESPLARVLVGCGAGSDFTLPNGTSGTVLAVQ